MMLLPLLTALLFAAAPAERPAIAVQAADAPVKIDRAVVMTPADGPPVLLYSATNLTDDPIDTFTVIAYVFAADGTLKARQTAPARRSLDPRGTKYSTLVLDGGPVDGTDKIAVGVSQAQKVNSDLWWRGDPQRAAEAAVPKKTP
jgi:hypothetical protein